MLIFSTVLLLICGNGRPEASGDSKNKDAPFEIHGRLSIYNGNPTFRIWIIGTNRILGIPGGDLEPADMPEKLEKLFTDTGIIVYGDFTVTPLTEYKPGVMQFVRIELAKNLVVYSTDRFMKKLPKIWFPTTACTGSPINPAPYEFFVMLARYWQPVLIWFYIKTGGDNMNISRDIKPVTYLKARASDLLRQINETHRPVVITQNGEPGAVLQDPESYENMRNAIGLLKLISLGEGDIKDGKSKSQEEVFTNIENILKEKMKWKKYMMWYGRRNERKTSWVSLNKLPQTVLPMLLKYSRKLNKKRQAFILYLIEAGSSQSFKIKELFYTVSELFPLGESSTGYQKKPFMFYLCWIQDKMLRIFSWKDSLVQNYKTAS
jgi:prevent-host-death family protein